MNRVVAAAACLWMLSTGGVVAGTLSLEHYLDWERAAGPQISPSGDEIVYTRTRVDKLDDRFRSEIWILDADGSRHRRLTRGGNVRWSPSGDRIAYVASGDGEGAQLHVRHMDDEGAVSQITHGARSPQDLRWSPDGKWIAFRAEVPIESDWSISLPPRPEGATWTEDAVVIDRLHYRMDRQGPISAHDHLFVVPADGGTPRQITSGEWDVGARFSGIDFSAGFDWTPDGKSIVFSGIADGEEELTRFVSHVNIVDVATGEIRTLTKREALWRWPRVSPDGTSLAYGGGVAEGINSPATELRLMRIDGGQDRQLIADLPSSLTALAWAPDGRGLYYGTRHEGRIDIFHVSTHGKVRQVTSGMHQVSMASMSDDGTAAAVFSSPEVTRNVATIDLASGTIRRLTDLNADILRDVDLGDVEELWYDSTDGLRIQGWIVKPPDFDPQRKYPLILSIHGGPEGMYGVGFSYRFHEFAAEGYVVLYTNPRGSTGYGSEFMHEIGNSYPGKGDYEDLMAGVDALLERGYVDETRLYATGCSGGGALTAWIVTRTDRFAAAASLCPVTNWISFGGTADVTAWGYTRFDPPFWEDPTLWLEHSPIMHVGKVSTPTLLMTGDLDLRTPLEQAEEFYAALKMRGVPTKLIAMRNEYHGTTSIPSNMLRTQLYLRKWFEQFPGEDEEEPPD